MYQTENAIECFKSSFVTVGGRMGGRPFHCITDRTAT